MIFFESRNHKSLAERFAPRPIRSCDAPVDCRAAAAEDQLILDIQTLQNRGIAFWPRDGIAKQSTNRQHRHLPSVLTNFPSIILP
jgi:hypothetical protein